MQARPSQRLSVYYSLLALTALSGLAQSQGLPPPSAASPFTSPQATGPAGQTVSMHLHPVGETGGCQTAVHVLNMHYPTQACAQSAADFSAKWLGNYHLKSKCPAGQPMKGVYGIDCLNAGAGSVFSATVCCGQPQRPNPLPAAINGSEHDHGHHHPSHMRLNDVPLKMETTAQFDVCPQPGTRFTRQSLAAPSQHWRGQERFLDNTCRSRGSPYGYYSLRIKSCTHQPNPHVPRQTQYFAVADVVCGR